VTAVWTKVRSDFRSSLGASIAIVLVIGLAGGVVLGAVAAGRRTKTAFPRFLATASAVVPAPVVDVAWIPAAIVVTVLQANLIAAIPARAAARTKPATVLRSE
jgi:ABC-type antimicrobial peptide transport system permease subunit